MPYHKPTGELIQLIEGPGADAWVAYYALAKKTDPAARQALLRGTKSTDWRHRRSAAEAIGVAGLDDELIARIRELLDDNSAYVVRTALAVIEEERLNAARPRVIELMSSEDPETRRSAIRAIAAIAEEEDIGEVLRRFRNDEIDAVHREAGWALYQNRSDTNWRTLLDEWKDDPLHRHRVWACDLVAEFGSPEELGLLEQLERDPDGHVRAAAARAKIQVQERGGV